MKFRAKLQYIPTKVGNIAVYIKEVSSEDLAVIFLHGVYFDHHLWDGQIVNLNERTTITIDMPWHGNSRNIIQHDWTLDDCAEMLIEILDFLKFQKVIAIGHSWGSMTILRAAYKHPERFEYLGLCNLPFLAASRMKKISFIISHNLLLFRDFYANKVGKFLFGKTSLKQMPFLLNQLKISMNVLTNNQIKQLNKSVIINAKNTTCLIKNLKVKAIALKGKDDYVSAPPYLEMLVVEGGHISPLEKPYEVLNFIYRLFKMANELQKQTANNSSLTLPLEFDN